MNFGTYPGPTPPQLFPSVTNQLILFSTSRTWVAPLDANYILYAIGAGGAGGAANGYQSAGGGAGGLCIKRVFLQKNTILNFTIGAGGTVTGGTGNTGGNTIISGNNINMCAIGGTGGAYNGSLNASATGGTGGGATGGDVNWKGGNAGTASTSGSDGGDYIGAATTGGGAVAWWGIGYSSANRSVTPTIPYGYWAIGWSGGAGIGSSGGISAAGTTQGAAYPATWTTLATYGTASFLVPTGNAASAFGCGGNSNGAGGIFGGGGGGAGDGTIGIFGGGAGGLGGGGGGAGGAGGAGFIMIATAY